MAEDAEKNKLMKQKMREKFAKMNICLDLRGMTELLGIGGMSEQQVKELFRKIDRHGRGEVDCDQLLDYIFDVRPGSRARMEARTAFQARYLDEGFRKAEEEDAKGNAKEEVRLKVEEENWAKAEERAAEEEQARSQSDKNTQAKRLDEAIVQTDVRTAAEGAPANANEESLAKVEDEAKANVEEEETKIQIEDELQTRSQDEAFVKVEEQAKQRISEKEDMHASAEDEAKAKADEEGRIKTDIANIKADVGAHVTTEEDAKANAAEEETTIRSKEEIHAGAEEDTRMKADDEKRINDEHNGNDKAFEDGMRVVGETANEKTMEDVTGALSEKELLKGMAEEVEANAATEARINAENDVSVKTKVDGDLEILADDRAQEPQPAKVEEQIRVKSKEKESPTSPISTAAPASVPSSNQSEESGADETATKAAFLEARNRPLPDLNNPDVLHGNMYSEIVPHLFLGGDYNPQKVAYFNGTIEIAIPKLGFVVRCSEMPSKCVEASDVPRIAFEPKENSEGQTCVGIHCFDQHSENDLLNLKECCVQIKEKLEQQCNVLVHCQQGVDCSAIVVAAFCMAYFDISTTDARESLQSLRPVCIEQQPGYEDFLRRNEGRIRQFFHSI